MSEKLMEFLRNNAGEPVLSVCVPVLQRDFENDRQKYVQVMERTLLQQVLEGVNLNELSVDGNKQLVSDVKKQFHIETFTENQKVYVKMWMLESFKVNLAKYERKMRKMLRCSSCGGGLGVDMKFCPNCGGKTEARK